MCVCVCWTLDNLPNHFSSYSTSSVIAWNENRSCLTGKALTENGVRSIKFSKQLFYKIPLQSHNFQCNQVCSRIAFALSAPNKYIYMYVAMSVTACRYWNGLVNSEAKKKHPRTWIICDMCETIKSVDKFIKLRMANITLAIGTMELKKKWKIKKNKKIEKQNEPPIEWVENVERKMCSIAS